ncbi:hypothetical protein E1264_05875 [Actinomadura sp. KC216]|uniref:hypothetical protein n=1 Tax=Actinomadura sp. KC216 TaxID=2530370 RepID=UPI001048394A|nr:hypothetical protein [Actinomadura sp. KC216]TDB90190.1 hypothetical protein E1264_05875 [Actinomadura sp. KC216]
MAERKKILLRLDPAVHDALARWAGDELRSTNAQIEFLLRRALADAGRMPGSAGRMRGRGRPRKAETEPGEEHGEHGEQEEQEEHDPPGPARGGGSED